LIVSMRNSSERHKKQEYVANKSYPSANDRGV